MNSSSLIRVVLRRGRDISVGQGHPWVFSGSVASWSAAPTPGGAVDVHAHDGAWLGRGLVNPDAELLLRIYTRREDEPLDTACLLRQADAAVQRRRALGCLGGDESKTNACRVVFSESDGLSGLVVDRFADLLVVQVTARVLLPHLPALIQHLLAATGTSRVWVQIPEADAAREVMEAEAAACRTDAPKGAVRFRENGFNFEWDATQGQKTGYYLDQQMNRRRVAALAAGRSVLSAYCYTGAFEVNLAAGGAADLTGVDSSAPALEQARRHCELNGVRAPVSYLRGNVPEVLRGFRDAGRSFDLIVLDPPRFVASRKQMDKGLRAYKDINLYAIKLLRPGGILATFSCSGLVSATAFQEAVRWASVDAKREALLLEDLCQPHDHPVHLAVPETRYLKGLIAFIV